MVDPPVAVGFGTCDAGEISRAEGAEAMGAAGEKNGRNRLEMPDSEQKNEREGTRAKARRSGIAEMKNDLKKTSVLRSSKW